MMAYSLTSMLACLGAVGATRLCDKTQQPAASFVAGCILFFWLIEELAYPPFDSCNPVRLFWAMGWKVHSESFWPVFDGMLGSIALASTASFWFNDRKAWWGPTIWALCIWSVVIHGIHQSTSLWGFEEYNGKLQPPFWARLAVFYAIAAKGVAEHASGLWNRYFTSHGFWSWHARGLSALARRDRPK